jgi:hypothetical protein
MSRTFYRGTTEGWECAIMMGSATHHPRLVSGKEQVLHKAVPDIRTMTAREINDEIVLRVGVETAAGTANYYSHFVPCADEPDLSWRLTSTRPGGPNMYEFSIVSILYGKSMTEVERYVAEGNALPAYAIPMFQGGNAEWLAMTGSLITSVVNYHGRTRTISMWSLD